MATEISKLLAFKLKRKSLFSFLIFFLIFSVLFAPSHFQFFKLFLIVSLLVFSIHFIVKSKKIPLYKSVFWWCTLYILINFIYLLVGTFNNIETFYQLFPVNVLWPIVFVFIIVIPSSKFITVNFTRTFIVSLIFIQIFIFSVYLNFINIIPDSSLLNLDIGQTINNNFNYLNFDTPSVTSLFFLLPYLVSILLVNKNPKSKILFYSFLIISGLILSIIIGRRTLLVIILLSPFVSGFWTRISSNLRINFHRILMIFSLIFLLGLIFINFVSIDLRVENLDTYLIQQGTLIRIDQFNSLIDGWLSSPLFGVGSGVNASIVRSTNVPGTYELTYVALLFHRGIFGLAIYFYMILWVLKKLIFLVRFNYSSISYIVPFLTGFTSLLLAESTNPYMGSFDGMWVLFLALAIINNLYLRTSYFKRKKI